MPKIKKSLAKDVKTKTSLKGKVMKRKNLKRSVAQKPLKKAGFRLLEQIPSPVKLELSPQDSSGSEDEVKETQDLMNYKQIEEGVNALYKYIEKTAVKKTEMFDDEQAIHLQITSIKVPKTPNRQIRLSLKHSLLSDSSEICLIVNDIGIRKDHEETIEYYEKILQKHGITNIKTIIPFHQFKNEYGNQYELKRKFLGLYDFFLVDGRISGKVVHLLGKIFYNKRKMPTPICMDTDKLKNQIEKALHKTLMKIHAKSDSFAVQVGHTKMSPEQVYENVIQIVKELSEKFPGGLSNVRELGVKTDTSILVPVYLTLKNKSTIKTPVERSKRPNSYNVSGELTTYLGRDVTVTPTGKIFIRDYRSDEESDEGEEEIEWNDQDQSDVDEKPLKIEEPELKENSVVDKKEPEVNEHDDDNIEILDQAEAMYLNQYEQEQVTTKKAKKDVKTSKKIKGPIKRASKRLNAIRNTTQTNQNKKTPKKTKIEEARGEPDGEITTKRSKKLKKTPKVPAQTIEPLKQEIKKELVVKTKEPAKQVNGQATKQKKKKEKISELQSPKATRKTTIKLEQVIPAKKSKQTVIIKKENKEKPKPSTKKEKIIQKALQEVKSGKKKKKEHRKSGSTGARTKAKRSLRSELR